MVLTLKDNRLTRIPFAIRRLKTLRNLNFADNQIKSLPNVFSRMSFDTLDVSGDEMLTPPYHLHEPNSVPLTSSSDILRQPAALWQLAAMVVMTKL